MRTRKLAGWALILGCLHLLGAGSVVWAADQATGVAGERVIRQLGGSTRFSPPVRTVDELRQMASSNRQDLETVLDMAGLSFISEQVLAALTGGDVTPATVPPGQRLEWMALRRQGQVDLIRSARWGGPEPFDAFQFTIETEATRYEFVVPQVCGNLTLVATSDLPSPPPPPVAEPAPAPPPPVPVEEPEPQPEQRGPWYVGADIGYVDVPDGKYDFVGAAVIPHRAEFDGGIGYFLQVGRHFDSFRVELELGRRENDTDQFGSINNIVDGKGSLDATSLMVNALYDFKVSRRFIPYLGLGLGAASIKADQIRKSVTDPDRTGVLFDDDDRFAWQALAGVSFPINERWAIKVDYRYFDAGDAKVKYGVGCNSGGSECIFTDGIEVEYETNTLSAGIRYIF